MGIRPETSNVGGVEKYIDTAYDNIKNVSDNLEALLNLNNTFNNLNGVYLGEFTVAPTLRGDNSPLLDGDHYLNTSTKLLYVRISDSWIYHSIFYTQDALNDAVGTGPFNIWIVYADDDIGTGITITPTNKAYVGFANGRVGINADITDASIYRFVRVSGEKGDSGVGDRLHIAYADSSDGLTNFNFLSGNYLGQLVDTNEVASVTPSDYNWVETKGEKGDTGTGATVVDNGDGTFTVTAENGSVVISDGITPQKDIDYYDGNTGDYISLVYGQVDVGDPAPTINANTGSYDGTNEVLPTGSITWGTIPIFTSGRDTYISTNRYNHDLLTDTWSLVYTNWASPTIFIKNPEPALQNIIKGFAFKRSSDPGFVETPTGGTFENPDPITTGWEDGIPVGTAPIFVSTATFTSDGLSPQNAGNPVVWAESKLLAESGEGTRMKFGPTITGPWSLVPNVTDEYMITSRRDSSGIWIDDTDNPIKIKGESGIDPQSKLRAFAFKRSADPAFSETPTGGTYTSPNPVDDIVTGWSDGIPAGTDRLYVSVRTFTSDGLSPQNTSWSVSQVFSYNGTGFRLLFSVDGLTDWHEEPTEFDEWAQPQTSADGGNTWVNSGEKYRFKGEKGDPGETILQVTAYKRAVTLPATPSDGSYDFDTRTLTPPAGWFAAVPTDTEDNVYIITSYINNSLGQQLNTIVWEDVALLAASGDDGAAGPRGSRHFYGTVTDGLWSDIAADTVITNSGETKTGWDVVTLADSANEFAESRYWNVDTDPDEWTLITEVIDGNLVVFGTIGADQIAANSINAEKISADSITAEKLSINTTGNEVGNASGVNMTFDPYSSTPISIINNVDSSTVFTIQLVDGEPKAVINGTAGTNFINNLSAITDDVKRALNPHFLGGGATANATPSNLADGGSESVVITNGTEKIVNIDFSFSTIANYFAQSSNQNWTAPVWQVVVRRGGSTTGTIIYNKTHTGTAHNMIDTELSLLWFGDYSLVISDGLVDTDAGVNQQYSIIVTRVSGEPVTIDLDSFSLEVPAFTTNTIDTNSAGGYSFTDKETGFTVKGGTQINVTGNGTSIVTFSNAFSSLWAAVATSDHSDLGDWATGSIISKSTSSITIQNQEENDHNFDWIAIGVTNV